MTNQMVLLHICCTCNTLVPFEKALAVSPLSKGANFPAHPACRKFDERTSGHYLAVFPDDESVLAAEIAARAPRPVISPDLAAVQ